MKKAAFLFPIKGFKKRRSCGCDNESSIFYWVEMLFGEQPQKP